MGLFKTIREHYLKVKNGNTIVNLTCQYGVYLDDKYMQTITFSCDNLNVAKYLVSRINHYTIDKVVIVERCQRYEFVGTDQYDKPVKLIAIRNY